MSEHVRPETHGFGAKLIFDDHGMSPYWGVVSAFDPDHEEYLEPFDAIGETWEVVSSVNWNGKIAPRDSDTADGGLYEYSYSIEAVDEIGDRDAKIQLRPGYPDAEHVETGELINGMPNDCPESIRVQVEATNVDHDDLLALLREFFQHIGLNPEYISEPHEWSRVFQIERYVRILRQVYEDHIVDGGILGQLADVMSNQRGKGKHRWDNEEIVGHYDSVADTVDTWDMLLPDGVETVLGKSVKGYHPANPRGDTSGDDPLAHPKVEAARAAEFDDGSGVPWDEVDDALEELDAALLNVLHWAGVPVAADAAVWVRYDDYFDVGAREEVDLRSNPLPELRETIVEHVESEMIRTELSPAQEEVLTVLTDGGSMHYESLADQADVGTSTVYRLVDALRSLLDTDNGLVRFADDATRRHVRGIVDRVRETADWAKQSIAEVAQEHDLLRSDDGPLQEWMQRHGVRVAREHPELELELDKPLGDVEIKEILRAGLEAAERSGLLTERFERGRISWRTIDGQEKRGRQIVVDGKILGQGALKSLR